MISNPLPPLLEIRDAAVMRGGRPILDRISLRIEQGQHTAILGPNGSGKTTLIRLITREYYPLASPDGAPTISLLGHTIWDLFELRSRMGIVSGDIDQDFSLGDADGFEVVLSGFFSSRGVYRHHLVTEAMRESALEALQSVGLGHFAEKPAAEMSTGELRRVMIARALAPNPPSLLLDEPTAGLDPVARRRFLETLRGVARASKTIVLVTHHVEEILPEIDNIVLMREGNVVRTGTKRDALTSETLSDTFGAPMRISERDGYFSADVR